MIYHAMLVATTRTAQWHDQSVLHSRFLAYHAHLLSRLATKCGLHTAGVGVHTGMPVGQISRCARATSFSVSRFCDWPCLRSRVCLSDASESKSTICRVPMGRQLRQGGKATWSFDSLSDLRPFEWRLRRLSGVDLADDPALRLLDYLEATEASGMSKLAGQSFLLLPPLQPFPPDQIAGQNLQTDDPHVTTDFLMFESGVVWQPHEFEAAGQRGRDSC